MSDKTKYKKILIKKGRVNTALSGNSRYTNSYGRRHLYRDYLKHIGQMNSNGRILPKKNKKYLSYNDFLLILKVCNDLVTTGIAEGNIFKLPSSLGVLLVKKPKFTPFAFEQLFDRKNILATKYTKDSSYRLRIYWKKGGYKRDHFYESTLYKFRPCANFKKKITNQVNNHELGSGVYNSVY